MFNFDNDETVEMILDFDATMTEEDEGRLDEPEPVVYATPFECLELLTWEG